MKTLNLEEKVNWQRLKEEDLFFQPQVDDLLIKGHNTGWQGIYRELGDGKIDPIGMRSDSYQIVQNKDIHQVINEFDNFPLQLDYMKSSNNRNSKFQLVYVLDKYILDDEEDGGKLMPNLVVINSYDGTKRLKLEFGFFRMICANMHVIPIKNRTFSISEKHYKGNFRDALKDIIYPWLNDVVNEKVFDEIRNKIQSMKKNNEEVFLPYDFFKTISMHDAIVFIKLMKRFSQLKIYIDDYDEHIATTFDNNGAELLIQKLIQEKHGDKKMEKNWDIESRLEKLNEVCYNETVNSQWMFYCMMIKISQFLVNKERRLDYSKKISSLFFGEK